MKKTLVFMILAFAALPTFAGQKEVLRPFYVDRLARHFTTTVLEINAGMETDPRHYEEIETKAIKDGFTYEEFSLIKEEASQKAIKDLQFLRDQGIF